MVKRILALALTLLLLLPAIHEGSAAVIALGSRGEKVVLVQQALKRWGYLEGDVDGNFGRATYNAVVSFQRKNGLRVDGQVGSATAAALGVNLSGGAVSASLYRETELALLSRLVSGEVYTPKSADGRREADLIYGYIHPCCAFPLSDVVIDVPPVVE